MRTIRKVGKSLAFYLSDPRNLFATEKIGTSNDGLNYWCLRENYIERSILNTGFWELHETHAVKRTLRPGWIVFDIGANIGYFTLLMSKLVGAGGQVHGFEPTGYAFERLERNIDLNPTLPSHNIRLNKKGLSSSNTQRTEFFESRFSSRVLAHDQAELIDFLTLDEYVASMKLDRVDFIKIDVDGYDYEVIKGAAEVLSNSKPTIMAEICDRVLRPRGVNVGAYLALYLEAGYRTCEMLDTEECRSLKDVISDPKIQSGSWNVLIS